MCSQFLTHLPYAEDFPLERLTLALKVVVVCPDCWCFYPPTSHFLKNYIVEWKMLQKKFSLTIMIVAIHFSWRIGGQL
jgi:hypothetical protein